MNPIFVYGILRGRTNAQRATVSGYSLIDMGPFPAAIEDEERDCILGELIYVHDAERQAFDMVEGHPYFYVRTTVEVEIEDGGEVVTAEMYVLRSMHVPSPVRMDRVTTTPSTQRTYYEYR